MEVGIILVGGIFWKKTSTYINAINKEWRVKEPKKSINVEGGNVHGGWIFFSKSISVPPRLLER